jgi:hypothetical protein
LLAAALILIPQAALSQTVTITSSPGIGLGYGPKSIVPVSAGVPIYTEGDSIWAQSYINSSTITLILSSPKGTVTNAVYLSPDSIAMVYAILPSDPPGEWTLTVYPSASSSTFFQVDIEVSNATSLQAPAYVGAGLSDGAVSIGYEMPTTSAYAVQACLLGAQASPETVIALPTSLGGGMDITLNGTTVSSFSPSSKVAFDSWFELYTQRTWVNGTNLVSEQVLAGETQVVTEGVASGAVTAGLETNLNLRNGRYDLRTYVRDSSGLLTFDTPYLRASGGTWISLQGCSSLANVASEGFDLDARLNTTTSQWPRYLLTMYDVNGIDSFTMSSVPTREVRVDLGNSTQARELTHVGVKLSGPGVATWEAYNGSVYVIASSFPLDLSVVVSFENITSETFQAGFAAPFETTALQIPTATINVTTFVSGVRLANATVSVGAVGSSSGSVRTNSSASASIILPPGSYNLTLSNGGSVVSQTVQLSQGQTVPVALDIAPPGPPVLAAALALVLVASVGANLLVWRTYARRKSSFG